MSASIEPVGQAWPLHGEFRTAMANAVTSNADVASSAREPVHSGRGKRFLLVALGLVGVVGVLAGIKFWQVSSLIAFGKRAQAAGPPPETVGSAVVAKQDWSETLESVGSVTAARGVTVSNDAPGIVSRLTFESGATVRAGQLLVELDSSVERAQLSAARVRRQLAETNASRTRALAASGSVAPAQKDADETQLSAATADERAITAQIERKVVRAPFAGKLGIRLVNVGQYLAPGTPITLLESNDDQTYVDFALPQEDIGLVAVGMPVKLTLGHGEAEGSARPAEGSIYAVEPAVDPTTRNIKLRATVPPEKERFRPGMFVNVSVVRPQKTTVLAIPAAAVVHASFGDSIFIIEDEKPERTAGKPSKIARQQFVRPGRTRGDFAAITDGLEAGQEVVVAGAFKLRNGAHVVVNNEVEIHPELSPRPANR